MKTFKLIDGLGSWPSSLLCESSELSQGSRTRKRLDRYVSASSSGRREAETRKSWEAQGASSLGMHLSKQEENLSQTRERARSDAQGAHRCGALTQAPPPPTHRVTSASVSWLSLLIMIYQVIPQFPICTKRKVIFWLHFPWHHHLIFKCYTW